MTPKLMFLNIKTTGLNSTEHGIFQLAGQIQRGNKTPKKFDYKFSPFDDNKIDKKALDLSKISRQEVFKLPDPNETIKQFRDLMNRYVDPYNSNDKFTVITYNSQFHYDFLSNWFYRLDDDYMNSWFYYQWVDVNNLAAAYLMDKRDIFPNLNLNNVAKALGIEGREKLGECAAYDVEIMKQIFMKIKLI